MITTYIFHLIIKLLINHPVLPSEYTSADRDSSVWSMARSELCKSVLIEAMATCFPA